MEIELRHLRYFVAVADHGGMRRAADALGVLHATLSHRLRDLEEEVGVALFFRSNKGVEADQNPPKRTKHHSIDISMLY